MKNIQKVAKYSAVLIVLLASFVIPTVSHAQFYYPLQASCRPNTNYAQTNTSVGWSVSVSGGNGYYTYSWTGTDGIIGDTNSILKTYMSEGIKSASVTVTSGGQPITVNCGNVNVYSNSAYYYNYYPYNYAPINGSCSANVTNAQIGNTINWSGTATGGNGVYVYSWSDSDGYNSGGQYFSRYYTSGGNKYMNLTITSNGQSITRICSVYITPNIVASSNQTYPIYSTYQTQNQVLSYNNTNSNLASVYLSDVPYTGFDDVARIILFISALILWSAMLAYMFLKKREVTEILVPEKAFIENKVIKVKISADEKNLKQIEDYARTYKVLLSSEASQSILKLSKLGKINASETIQKMVGEDWTAIGEKDLEKYI